MKLLGAVIAGGKSSRFGEDKAAALMAGKPLIDHAIEALTTQVDDIVIVGRSWGEHASIPDYPRPDGGPLLGLCAALRHAASHGFDAVLTASCDTHPVPSDLAKLLSPGPSVVDGHWLFGLWPANLATELEVHINSSANHSMRGWISVSGAKRVWVDQNFRNINSAQDLQ